MKKLITLLSINALILIVSTFIAGCGSAVKNNSTEDSKDVITYANESEIMESVTELTRKPKKEIDPQKSLIALTFDDGPNLTTTYQVMEKLEKYNITASFFLVGNNINESTAEVVKKAYMLGCEICNHSKSHPNMTELTDDEVKEEIKYTSEKITEIIGEAPRFFRPPYIAVKNEMFDSIDLPFIAGIGANDWDDSVSAEERAEKIISQSSDGIIILLHDMQGNIKTVEALDIIIPNLLEQGYQFVTVSELFDAKGVDPLENNYVYTSVFQSKMYY